MLKILFKHFETPRKRTFPSGKTPLTIWGGPPAVIGSVNFMKSSKILKIHDFHQFSTFSSIWWLLVVSTTLYRPQKPGKCWKYCSNISKRLGNARFRAGKNSPDHLGWSTRVGRVIEFRRFPKIMKNHDFWWFSMIFIISLLIRYAYAGYGGIIAVPIV